MSDHLDDINQKRKPSIKKEAIDEKQANKTDEELRKKNKIVNVEWMFQEESKNNDSSQKKSKISFIKKLFKRDFPKIVASILIYLLQAGPLWILPLVTADVVDIVTIRMDGFGYRLLFDGVVLAFFLIIHIPVSIWRTSILNKLIRSTTADVKSSVILKLQRLSITYHKEIEEGRIQSKLLRDVENIEMYYRIILYSLLPSIIGAIISTGIAIWRSPIVVVFFFAVIPLNVFLTWLFTTRIQKNSHTYREENELLSSRLTTTIQMMSLSKAHGLLAMEDMTVKQQISRVTQAGLKLDKINAIFGAMILVSNQILSVCCLFFCVFLAFKGYLSTGEVFLFQSLFISISGSLSAIINLFPSLIIGKESIRSVSEIMNAGEEEENNGKIAVKSIKGTFDFYHVYYHYPKEDDYVVKNFNLHVEHGETIAIVGSSGSGKSTIMNLIIGLLSPTKGKILIDGQPMDEINMQDYRQFISVVPQNNILFSGTIRENITYGLNRYSEEELQKALDDANVSEFLPSLSHGLESQVGEHGDKLSGGQKQRISIARSLIRNPRILIMDEATSALDSVSEFHVQKAIESLISKQTTFIVAHRLSTIRNADRIVVMEKGCIAEMGTYEELMALNGRFCELEKLNHVHEKEERTKDVK